MCGNSHLSVFLSGCNEDRLLLTDVKKIGYISPEVDLNLNFILNDAYFFSQEKTNNVVLLEKAAFDSFLKNLDDSVQEKIIPFKKNIDIQALEPDLNTKNVHYYRPNNKNILNRAKLDIQALCKKEVLDVVLFTRVMSFEAISSGLFGGVKNFKTIIEVKAFNSQGEKTFEKNWIGDSDFKDLGPGDPNPIMRVTLVHTTPDAPEIPKKTLNDALKNPDENRLMMQSLARALEKFKSDGF